MATKEEVEKTIQDYMKQTVHNRWWATNCMTKLPFGPTDGNQIVPLIDGEAYGKQLFNEIRKAKNYVLITDWLFDNFFAIERTGTAARSEAKEWITFTMRWLVEELAKQKVQIRIVLWDRVGAKEVLEQKVELEQAGAGYCDVVLSSLFPVGAGSNKILGSLHQKTVVIDGKVAFCGGIDLAWREEADRWDTPKHFSNDARRRGKEKKNWHDIQVQVKGPAVKWIQENFKRRWQVASGKDLNVNLEWPASPQGKLRAQVLRTIPKQPWMEYGQPADTEEYSIVESYARAIINAKKMIYIENQYFTCKLLFDILCQRLKAIPGLHLIVLLPNHKAMGPPMSGIGIFLDGIPPHYAVNTLQEAAPNRVFFGLRVNDKEDPVYVHAKIMIIDDIYANIGSSNFSDRSMFNQDQELDIAWVDESGTTVSEFRKRLWAEHLNINPERPCLDGSSAELLQLWKSGMGLVRKWEDESGEKQRGPLPYPLI